MISCDKSNLVKRRAMVATTTDRPACSRCIPSDEEAAKSGTSLIASSQISLVGATLRVDSTNKNKFNRQ